MANSRDLRERVLAHLEEGNTQESAARIYKVSRTSIVRWRRQYQETGSLDRKPLNRKPKKLAPEKVVAYVTEHPVRISKKSEPRLVAQAKGCVAHCSNRRSRLKKGDPLQRARRRKARSVYCDDCKNPENTTGLCG